MRLLSPHDHQHCIDHDDYSGFDELHFASFLMENVQPYSMVSRPNNGYSAVVRLEIPGSQPEPRIFLRDYGAFTEDGHWYLFMDFIEGETLEEYLEQGHKHLTTL
jgi:hypothetical protein